MSERDETIESLRSAVIGISIALLLSLVALGVVSIILLKVKRNSKYAQPMIQVSRPEDGMNSGTNFHKQDLSGKSSMAE